MDRLVTCIRWAFAVSLVVVLVFSLLPPQIAQPIGWDKMNHALTFAVLAMLGCSAHPGRKVQVLAGLLAYGVLIELLQSLTGYRKAEAMDVVADGVGLVAGWTLTRLLWRARLASRMPDE